MRVPARSLALGVLGAGLAPGAAVASLQAVPLVGALLVYGVAVLVLAYRGMPLRELAPPLLAGLGAAAAILGFALLLRTPSGPGLAIVGDYWRVTGVFTVLPAVVGVGIGAVVGERLRRRKTARHHE
jgi:hypothetical protein